MIRYDQQFNLVDISVFEVFMFMLMFAIAVGLAV